MTKTISISRFDQEWGLEFNSKGFEIVDQGTSAIGDSTHVHASNKNSGISISIYLEPARKENSSIFDCRDFYWNRMQENPAKKEDVVMKEVKDMAIIEYIVPEYEGKRIDHKNINAFMVKNDVWIDIHVSTAFFKEKEIKELYSLLESVKFVKKDVPKMFKVFLMATRLYMEKNYSEAIKGYLLLINEEMVKSEKLSLPIHYLRTAIDNAGMAYGITGNLEMAKEMFELGLKIDPEYPSFYYNLACAYAEMNDLENSIVNLESCLKYKNNLVSGEVMPDPSSDNSFQRFMKDERFLEIVKKYTNKGYEEIEKKTFEFIKLNQLEEAFDLLDKSKDEMTQIQWTSLYVALKGVQESNSKEGKSKIK